MEKVPCMKNTLRTLGLAAFMVAASGCSIIFPYEPPGCEPLNEICPDLACDAYVVEEGCAICECAEPVIEGCYSDQDCGQGERCNTEDFCDSPPGCEPGEPCPAVCYGRCEVADSSDCFSDADCNEGEFCQFGFGPETEPVPPEDREEDEGQDSDELIAQGGQCVPFEECDDRQAPPACPDGFVLDVDFSFDPCGEFFCRPLGSACEDLSAEQCEDSPNCRLERQGGCPPCEPDQEECECFEELFCVAADFCGDIRDVEACEETEGCRAVFPTDGGGAIPPEDDCFERCDGDDECIDECFSQAPLPPQEEFFCIEDFGEECFSDFDCAPGAQCNDGQCIGGEVQCFELDVEECLEFPGCRIEDVDCDCEESDANCFCEGFCVPDEDVSPPNMCISDADCADDEACMIFEECRECADDENCDEECQFMGECVPQLGPPPCDPDAQCADGEACIDGQCQVGESLCLENDDCPAGMRCATELELCACPAGEDCDTCFSICLEDEDPAE